MTQTYKKNFTRSQALMDGAVVICETFQPVDKCFPKYYLALPQPRGEPEGKPTRARVIYQPSHPSVWPHKRKFSPVMSDFKMFSLSWF